MTYSIFFRWCEDGFEDTFNVKGVEELKLALHDIIHHYEVDGKIQSVLYVVNVNTRDIFVACRAFEIFKGVDIGTNINYAHNRIYYPVDGVVYCSVDYNSISLDVVIRREI